MSNYVGKTLSAQGSLEISKELGKGGEGSVYEVASHSIPGLPEASEMVAKIYHNPEEGGRAPKVVAMLRMPPESDSVAWPLAVIAENGKFVGYLMKKLDSKNYRSWAELSNTKDRRGTSSSFDVQYAISASRNLAVAIHSIHEAGHKVGDVNESNIFIGTDSGVFIVDTDSAQIEGMNGKIHKCLVGKPEYTAAEITNASFKDVIRTEETDIFAYGVSIFQMLTGGAHPTDGVFLSEDEDPPSTVEKIRAGVLPGLDPQNSPGYKPVKRIPTQAIPQRIQQLLIKILQPNPNDRPSLTTIIKVLDDVLNNLEQCSRIDTHWYDSRDGKCYWCEHLDRGNLDPWSLNKPKPSSSGISQTKLPSVTFNDGSQAPTKAKRAAPTVSQNNGQQGASHPQQGNYSQPSGNPYNSQNGAYGTPPNFNSGGGQQQYPPQGYPQGFGQQYPPYPPQQQNAPEPDLPKFHKGKMILDYADGSRRVRPPLSQLVKQGNTKVAIRCLKEETPEILQAWWNPSRKVAMLWGLVVGFVLTLLISTSWFYLLPKLSESYFPISNPYIPDAVQTAIINYFSLGASITAVVACLCLMFSGMVDMLHTKKQYGSLENLKREKMWVTILRFIPISIFYGPFFLLILIGVIIMALISFIMAVIRTR